MPPGGGRFRCGWGRGRARHRRDGICNRGRAMAGGYVDLDDARDAADNCLTAIRWVLALGWRPGADASRLREKLDVLLAQMIRALDAVGPIEAELDAAHEVDGPDVR